MNADGTNQTQLTFEPPTEPLTHTGPNLDGNPSWSPSGTQIAFEGLDSGTASSGESQVVNASGGTPSILFDGIDPDWSPRP